MRHASKVGRTARRLVKYTTIRFSAPGILIDDADVSHFCDDGGELLFTSTDGNFSGSGCFGLFVANERLNWLARRTRWKTECLLAVARGEVVGDEQEDC